MEGQRERLLGTPEGSLAGAGKDEAKRWQLLGDLSLSLPPWVKIGN